MKIYTILLLPTIFSPVCILYKHFRCPFPSERRFRAKWFCQKYGLKEENYACLYDRILNVYSESCKFQVSKLRPGEKFVITHTPAGVSCENADRYQPFGLEQFSDECVYRRSMCSVLGQVRFYRGSSIVDKSCRCNFKEEYRFVSIPQTGCYCYPSIEDCSCYLHRCPENYTLTPDYQCIHITNKSNISRCPDIAPKERSATEKTDFQEIYVVKGLSHGKEILTSFIGLCLLYIVVTFFVLEQDKLPSNCYRYISLNPPTNLRMRLENGILTLTWSAPRENIFEVESYILVYTLNEWEHTTYIRVDAKKSSCIIPHVLPTKTYRFVIASCWHEIDGKPSNQCSFNSGRPNRPSKLVMTGENGSIILMWTPPAVRLFKTDSYCLEVSNDDWKTMTTVSIKESVLSYVIKNCTTNSTYRCNLYSVSNSVKSLPAQAIFLNNIQMATQTKLTPVEEGEEMDTLIRLKSNSPMEPKREKENFIKTCYDIPMVIQTELTPVETEETTLISRVSNSPSEPERVKESLIKTSYNDSRKIAVATTTYPSIWNEYNTSDITKQISGRETDTYKEKFDLQDNKKKGSWFYKLNICCDGKMVNIDSCNGNTICSNTIKQLKDITSKDKMELSSYLHSILSHKEKEFELLLIFSTLLKTSIIRPEDWLLTVIEHQHRMTCYMLLAYMTGTETEKEDVFLPTLKMAFEKGAHKITNTISWFIIRKLFKSFSFDIDSLIDLWPAFVCKNTNCQESSFCSKELVIMVDTKQSTGDLPITFWNIEIKYLTQGNSRKAKKQVKGQLCSDAYLSTSRKDVLLEKFEIDGNLASQLFRMHSKLTCICKSVYKSKDGAKIERPCVQLFCRGKGFIPVKEKHFPKSVNNVETDILEGTPALAGRLRVGEKINSEHFSGTLGGFVEVLGDILFLTCAHVVVHDDNISGKRLTFPRNKAVYMDCVQTLPTTPNSPNLPTSEYTFRCGKLQYIEFKTDKPGETSIDAALFKLQENIGIEPEDFIANRMNEKQNFQFLGMRSPFLNDNCVDCDKMFHGISFRQFENITVGAESCFCVNQSTIHLVEDKEEGVSVDREPITETYKKIIESENLASSSHFNSAAPIFSNNAHLQETRLKKLDKERTVRRLSRCMYNQIAVTHIPFLPGDSGTCIYVRDNSLKICGCIGMAIANHPDLDGGVIVTPMKEILKTFHVDMQ